MATFDRRIDVKHENEDDWYISGMCVVSDEKHNYLVVADANTNSLKLINLDCNKIDQKVILPNAPRSVAALSNDYIAVTIPSQEQASIQFCRLKKSVLEQQLIPILDKEDRAIDKLENCYGLDVVDNHMIVTICPPTKDEQRETESEVEKKELEYTAAMVFKYEGDKLTLLHTFSRDKMNYSKSGRLVYVKGVLLRNGERGFLTSDVTDRQVSMYQYTEDENDEENMLLLWKQSDKCLHLKEPRCMVSLDKDTLLAIGRLSGNVAVLKIYNECLKFERNVIKDMKNPCSSCFLPDRKEIFISCSSIKDERFERDAHEQWERNQRFIQVWKINDDK